MSKRIKIVAGDKVIRQFTGNKGEVKALKEKYENMSYFEFVSEHAIELTAE